MLRALCEADALEDAADHAFKLRGREEGRRAAPEVHLGEGNRRLSPERVEVHPPLLQDGVDVRVAHARVLRDARVAAAVGAERAAEGDVDVDGRARPFALYLVQA